MFDWRIPLKVLLPPSQMYWTYFTIDLINISVMTSNSLLPALPVWLIEQSFWYVSYHFSNSSMFSSRKGFWEAHNWQRVDFIIASSTFPLKLPKLLSEVKPWFFQDSKVRCSVTFPCATFNYFSGDPDVFKSRIKSVIRNTNTNVHKVEKFIHSFKSDTNQTRSINGELGIFYRQNYHTEWSIWITSPWQFFHTSWPVLLTITCNWVFAPTYLYISSHFPSNEDYCSSLFSSDLWTTL